MRWEKWKSSPVSMRTPAGSFSRTAISAASSSRLIFTPRIFAGSASMMRSRVSAATAVSVLPKYPSSCGSKAVPSQCSTTGSVASESTRR